jgi:hypothetical protein
MSALLWTLAASLSAVGAGYAMIKRVDARADTFVPKVKNLLETGLLDGARLDALQTDLRTVRPLQSRRENSLRKGGAIPRAWLEARAPAMRDLYYDPAVRALAERIFELAPGSLQLISDDNQQSLCVYLYDQPGDFIAWHFDKPAYNSHRFALLVCLECTGDSHFETRHRSFPAQPGDAVFFIGERMKHRVPPVAAGASRVMLQLEYVTDNRKTAGWRTAMRKGTDQIFYFGFRAPNPKEPT